MQEERTRAIIVDNEKCNGCHWCITACQFGAISLDPEKGVAIVCDYCNGDPVCVKYCPFDGALTYTTIDEISHTRRKDVFRQIVEESGGKRV